jgi:hypothetical protein
MVKEPSDGQGIKHLNNVNILFQYFFYKVHYLNNFGLGEQPDAFVL